MERVESPVKLAPLYVFSLPQLIFIGRESPAGSLRTVFEPLSDPSYEATASIVFGRVVTLIMNTDLIHQKPPLAFICELGYISHMISVQDQVGSMPYGSEVRVSLVL